MAAKRPTLAASVPVVMQTTAATERRPAALTVASRISPTVLPSARPVMPTTVGTERRFRCRQTLTVRPTIPTARPNVPPGAVTQGIKSPGQAAFRKRKPVPITGTLR